MTEAPKKVPRRMRRFYRDAHREKQQMESDYRGGYEEPSFGTRRPERTDDYYSGDLESAFEKVDTLPEEQREKKSLSGIPSMDYEDMNLDEKNEKELRRLGEQETEEKLSLFEIEKFKKKNKRLPNKDERTMLAENVFEQMKKEKEESQEARGSRRRGRHRRAREEASEEMDLPNMSLEEEPVKRKRGRRGKVPVAPPAGDIGEVSDFKDLLGEEPSGKKKKLGDEMDLGLGDLDTDLGEDDLEGMDDLSFDLDAKKKKKK